MGIGWPQLLILALVILVLFGRGRISEMMGDFGKGIKSFKSGMNEEDAADNKPNAQIQPPAASGPCPSGQTGIGGAGRRSGQGAFRKILIAYGPRHIWDV